MSDEMLHNTTVELSVPSQRPRTSSTSPACLLILNGPRLGLRSALYQEPVFIGRSPSCDITLDVDSVSRKHARVEWSDKHHVVVDLGSTNGTFVNEQRIGERALEDGDRLQIGKIHIKYLSGSNVETAYHEEIVRLMRFDGLTGAANRSHWDEQLAEAVQAGGSGDLPVSLVVVDLDHFKQVNDTFGHTAGDAVLRQVAGRIQATVPPSLLVGRTGGEELAILCCGLTEPEARELAERVRIAVASAPCTFDGQNVAVTMSAGVAQQLRGEHAQSLYERADQRLYEAKAAGRNRVV